MKINPIEHVYGKPKPKPISFGIYKGSEAKHYGTYMWGKWKDYKIEIYDAYVNKQKLIYISDRLNRFLKSKLIYFDKEGNRQHLKSGGKK